MKNKFKYFLENSKGVSTIEFALTIGLFLAVILSIFELARMSILSAYMDLTLSQAVKITKNTKVSNFDYEDEFGRNLNKITENLKKHHYSWQFLDFNDDNLIKFEVKYADSIGNLINGTFRNTLDSSNKKVKEPGKNAALAKYSFQYKYKPMFFWVPDVISNPIFNREMVILQEYERSQHEIH